MAKHHDAYKKECTCFMGSGLGTCQIGKVPKWPFAKMKVC